MLGETVIVTSLFETRLSTRAIPFAQPELAASQDVTGDGLADVLVQDALSNRLVAITFTESNPALHHLPYSCQGTVTLRDANGDDTVDLLRGECGPANPKTIYTWRGDHFARLSP